MSTRTIVDLLDNTGQAARSGGLQTGVLLIALMVAGCGGSSGSSGSSVGLDNSASQPASMTTPEEALRRAVIVLEMEDTDLLQPLAAERQVAGWASELANYSDAVPGQLPGATEGVCDDGGIFVELAEDHDAPESFAHDQVDLAVLMFDRCEIDSENSQGHQITTLSDGRGEFGVGDPASMQDLEDFDDGNFEDFETYLIRLGDQPQDRYILDQRNHNNGQATRIEHYARLYADEGLRVGEKRIRARLGQAGQAFAEFTWNLLPADGESAHEVVFSSDNLTSDSRGRMQVDFVGDPPPSAPIDPFECVAPGEFEFDVTQDIPLTQSTTETGQMIISNGTVTATIDIDPGSSFEVNLDTGASETFDAQQFGEIREEVRDTCLGAVL